MFDAKKLSEDQVLLIGQWAANGAQLADIQKRLEDEMEFRLSYMDTRFLILDLGVEIRNLAQEEAEAEQSEQEEAVDSESDVKNANELTEEDVGAACWSGRGRTLGARQGSTAGAVAPGRGGATRRRGFGAARGWLHPCLGGAAA